jgi:peptidyl-prolyl cis-trans isomerase SurA
MYRKRIIIFSLIAGLSSARAQQQVIDQIAAVVDDNIILASELEQYTRQLAIQLGINQEKEPEKFQTLRKNTLSNLVVQKVLLTKAKEDSVTVDDRVVDQNLEEQIKRMVESLGSEEKLEEYFGQPLRKIRRTLRQEIADRALVESLQSRKMREIRISRREIDEFYKAQKDSLPALNAAVKLSHILFLVEAGENAQRAAKARIDSLLSLARSGEDFAELAKQFSEDPGSASRGGELGLIERGDFVKEFEEAAFALKPNEISDVVKTQFGFHIIQLIERRGEKINARHILARLSTTANDDSAAYRTARQCRDDILSGKYSFVEAARKFSQDKTTQDAGGDLGWFEADQLEIPAFRQAAQTLAVSEMTKPVKTQFGYHLVRLDERRESRALSLEQDFDQIQEMALYSKRQREFAAWVENLKKQLYVRVNMEI